jgi:hypothetical protein
VTKKFSHVLLNPNPFSRKPATGPYPEPDGSNPQPHTPFQQYICISTLQHNSTVENPQNVGFNSQDVAENLFSPVL